MAAESGRDNASDIQKPYILVDPGVYIESDPATGTDQTQKRSWFARNKWRVALGGILVGGVVATLAASGGDSGGGILPDTIP